MVKVCERSFISSGGFTVDRSRRLVSLRLLEQLKILANRSDTTRSVMGFQKKHLNVT